MNLRVKGMSTKKMWKVTHVAGVAELGLSLREVTVKKYNEHAIWLVDTRDDGNDRYSLVTRISALVSYFDTELEAQTFLSNCTLKQLLKLQEEFHALVERINSWAERFEKEEARRKELIPEHNGITRLEVP